MLPTRECVHDEVKALMHRLTAVEGGGGRALLALLLTGVGSRVDDTAGLAVLGCEEEVKEVDEAGGTGDGQDVAVA